MGGRATLLVDLRTVQFDQKEGHEVWNVERIAASSAIFSAPRFSCENVLHFRLQLLHGLFER
ncbi:MAG: hypothetical protein ACI9KE_003060 [Polyangiales bacterium]|jgi:hypothetical protein